MGMYNVLLFTIQCPWCLETRQVDAQFKLGWLNLTEYKIGDELQWEGGGLRVPRDRPVDGNLQGEGIANCPSCHRDFFVVIDVKENRIVGVEVDDLREED